MIIDQPRMGGLIIYGIRTTTIHAIRANRIHTGRTCACDKNGNRIASADDPEIHQTKMTAVDVRVLRARSGGVQSAHLASYESIGLDWGVISEHLIRMGRTHLTMQYLSSTHSQWLFEEGGLL